MAAEIKPYQSERPTPTTTKCQTDYDTFHGISKALLITMTTCVCEYVYGVLFRELWLCGCEVKFLLCTWVTQNELEL